MLKHAWAPVALATALATPLPGGLAAQDVPFRVVVHTSNTVTRLTRDQVSQVFLRRLTLWSNGRPVMPVDQGPSSPVRRSFSRQVHLRTVALVQTYWQQQRFMGSGVAPPERGSDAEVLTYIRQNPNAIGYVRADTNLGTDVKAVVLAP